MASKATKEKSEPGKAGKVPAELAKTDAKKNQKPKAKESAKAKKPKEQDPAAKEKAAKAKALTMLLNGASPRSIKELLGADADTAIEAVLGDIAVTSVESTTKLNVERLSYLATCLMPKAKKGNEVAINAVVKIMQVQQQLVLAYNVACAPHTDSDLERFRDSREARRNKNTSAYRP